MPPSFRKEHHGTGAPWIFAVRRQAGDPWFASDEVQSNGACLSGSLTKYIAMKYIKSVFSSKHDLFCLDRHENDCVVNSSKDQSFWIGILAFQILFCNPAEFARQFPEMFKFLPAKTILNMDMLTSKQGRLCEINATNARWCILRIFDLCFPFFQEAAEVPATFSPLKITGDGGSNESTTNTASQKATKKADDRVFHWEFWSGLILGFCGGSSLIGRWLDYKQKKTAAGLDFVKQPARHETE